MSLGRGQALRAFQWHWTSGHETQELVKVTMQKPVAPLLHMQVGSLRRRCCTWHLTIWNFASGVYRCTVRVAIGSELRAGSAVDTCTTATRFQVELIGDKTTYPSRAMHYRWIQSSKRFQDYVGRQNIVYVLYFILCLVNAFEHDTTHLTPE